MKRNSKHVCLRRRRVWVTCVYREKHLSFDIFCQKAEEKKNPFRERTVSGAAAIDKRKYLRPLIISIYNLSPLYISPALCQRASERFADVWHVSLGCEVDSQDLHKDPTTLPRWQNTNRCVPKMLVTQFFFATKTSVTPPPLPLIAHLLKRPSSQHTQHFAEHTLLLFSFLFCGTSWEIRPIILSICFWGAYWYTKEKIVAYLPNNKSSNRIVATQ